MMNELGDVMWTRAVIPQNAVSNDVEIIGTGDASEALACAACYIRYKCSDGSYSCQLMLAKTKIVPEDKTLPQAELLAATLNCQVTEIVKRALKRLSVTRVIYVLDSEIALHWIASKTKRLKPWVRNRVIEISRFSNVADWFHVESELNPADAGTRKGAKIDDIRQGSKWIGGDPWMHLPLEDLKGSVLKDVNDVKLKAEQLAELNKEQVKASKDLCASEYHLIVHGNECDATDSAVVTIPDSHAYVSGDESPEDLLRLLRKD